MCNKAILYLTLIMDKEGKIKNYLGVILAGGQSRRMGRDKAFLKFQGKRMIDLAVEKMTRIFPHVVISANHQKYGEWGLELVFDKVPGKGPAGGILSVMEKYPEKDLVVLGCDLPFVPDDLLYFLMDMKKDYDCVIPQENKKLHPLCAIYGHSCLPVFRKNLAQNKLKIQKILDELNTLVLPVNEDLPFYSPHILANINTPEELKKWKNYFNEREQENNICQSDKEG